MFDLERRNNPVLQPGSGAAPPADTTRAPALIGAYTALTLLATVFLAVRLYTRFKIVHAPGMDDLILVLSMLGMIIPGLVCVGMQTKYGLGRHIFYLSELQQLLFVKWNYITEPFCALSPCVPKFAVVVFFHRCMGKLRRRAIYVLYALVACSTGFTTVDIFLSFFQCSPAYGPWTAHVATSCPRVPVTVYFAYFAGATSAFADLVLALFPLTFVPRLQISLKQKIALCCLMGLGVFACACAIVRTSKTGHIGFSEDPTWDGTILILWGSIESNLIVICASVPAIAPLVYRKVRAKGRSDQTIKERPRDHRRQLMQPSTDDRKSDDEHSDSATTSEGEKMEGMPSDSQILTTTEVSVKHGQP